VKSRYVRDGGKSRQKRGKRRGAVFCIRLTDEERSRFEARMLRGDGPRSLGAWLKWRAEEPGNTRARGAAGNTLAGGTTRPGRLPSGNTDGQKLEKGNTRSSGKALESAWKKARKCPTHPTDHACDFCASKRARNIVYPPPADSAATMLVSCTACDRCLDGPEGKQILARRFEMIVDSWTGAPERLILDLCAGSGAWSEPYVKAGYRVVRVTLPKNDVRTYVPPKGVWGIVAAPPCEAFSLAANGHEHLSGPEKRAFDRGLEAVAGCLRVIALARPQWWALENPAGYLSRFLGPARDIFEPCDFGDPWTKKTALWGAFEPPKRGPYVKPNGPGPHCVVCKTRPRKALNCSNPAHRAITPAGFARAFFEANP